MPDIQACIFDLDGVIVDTAKYHFKAWRRLANDLGFDFTEKENERLKGVSRVDSLNLILEWGGVRISEEEKLQRMTQKNDWYLEDIDQMTEAEILPGVPELLEELADRNVKIALGSASKNAIRILDRIGLKASFEAIIDGTKTTRGKPDPQVFELGAEALGADHVHCIVFEDAAKGVTAALAAGMFAVGIGESENLGKAHLVIPGFADWNFKKILGHLPAKP